MEIRTMNTQDDFAAAAQVYVRSWQHSYRDILPQPFLNNLTAERWMATLRARPERSVVLLDGDVMAGTAMTDFCREKAGYGEIISLYLLPEYMGSGWGRRLLEQAMQVLRVEGCERVCLWVFEQNQDAADFYRHMGFTRTGRTQTETYAGHEIKLFEMERAL